MHDLVGELALERALGRERGLDAELADLGLAQAAGLGDVADDGLPGVVEQDRALLGVELAAVRAGEVLVRALVLLDVHGLDLHTELGQRVFVVEPARADADGLELAGRMRVDLLGDRGQPVVAQARLLDPGEHVAARVANPTQGVAQLLAGAPAHAEAVGLDQDHGPIAGSLGSLEPAQHRDQRALITDLAELVFVDVDASAPIDAALFLGREAGLERDAVDAGPEAGVHADPDRAVVPGDGQRDRATQGRARADQRERVLVEQVGLDALDLAGELDALVAQREPAIGEQIVGVEIAEAPRAALIDAAGQAARELEPVVAERAQGQLAGEVEGRAKVGVAQIGGRHPGDQAEAGVVAHADDAAEVDLGRAQDGAARADPVHADPEAAPLALAEREREAELGRGSVLGPVGVEAAAAEAGLERLKAKAEREAPAEVDRRERAEARAAGERVGGLVAEQGDVESADAVDHRGVELERARVAAAREIGDRSIDAVVQLAVLGDGLLRSRETGQQKHRDQQPEASGLHWISSSAISSTIASR